MALQDDIFEAMKKLFGQGAGVGFAGGAGDVGAGRGELPEGAPVMDFGAGPAAMRIEDPIGRLDTPTIQKGPTFQRRAGAKRERDFLGLQTSLSDEAMDPMATPYAINWNGIEKPGSIAVRRGMIKMDDDRDTINGGAWSAYVGYSILPVPVNDMSEASNDGGLIIIGLSVNPGEIGNTSVSEAMLVRTGPRWGAARDLEAVGGRTITAGVYATGLRLALTNPVSQTLRATCQYVTGNVVNETVAAITIRYSTTAYPLDIDGDDGTNSVAFASADRDTWDGSSTQFDKASLAVGLYYVSAWAISREGVSKRVSASLTIT